MEIYDVPGFSVHFGACADSVYQALFSSKISVKLSVYYSLPRDILTFSSNERLGKCLRCRLPVNCLNEVFALASHVCWLNMSRFRR